MELSSQVSISAYGTRLSVLHLYISLFFRKDFQGEQTIIRGGSYVGAKLMYTSIKIIKNEVGCRDDTVPKTVDTRRHCEEE